MSFNVGDVIIDIDIGNRMQDYVSIYEIVEKHKGHYKIKSLYNLLDKVIKIGNIAKCYDTSTYHQAPKLVKKLYGQDNKKL